MTTDEIFLLVFGLVAAALIIWVIVIVRRAQGITNASESRLNTRLYAAVNDSTLTDVPAAPIAPAPIASAAAPKGTAPSGSKETRLAELSDLHDRGLIDENELAAARAKILAE
jgi:hypothetical protein